MAVIIDTLEVTLEPPEPAAGEAPPRTVPAEAPPPPPFRPLDIEDIARHAAERSARLWAH